MLVAVQAAWLGTLMSFGWYYQADFSNLADTSGQPLSWHYLSMAQGGHFSVVSRTIFWLFQHGLGLNYPATIVVRLLAQAVCTWLLARLLCLLVGRQPGVLVVTALYAFSPLLLDGLLWFTPSAGVIGAEGCVILALIGHVHYFRTREFRWAVLAAGGLFAAALQAEVTAAAALLLPLLTLGFLAGGPPRARWRELWRCWPEWTLIASPMVLFLGYFFFVASYGKAAHPVGLVDLLKVVGETWSATTVPSLLGGPWTWHDVSTGYIPISGPSWAVRGVSLAVLLMLVGWSVRRTGARALLAWSLPLGIAAVTVIIVALGRFDQLGLRIAHNYEYHFYTAVPAAVGIALAFLGPPAEATVRTAIPRRSTTIVAALVLVGSLVSAVTFTHRWSQNPSASYVDHLRAALDRAGPRVNLFDTPLPSRMVPVLEPNHYVSDVVGLLGAKAEFDSPGSVPRIVAPNGDIVPAGFLGNSQVEIGGSNDFCNYLVRGTDPVLKYLNNPVPANEWFLHLAYFQQHASVVYVSLLDAHGREFGPRTGTRVVLSGQLGSLYLPMTSGAPVTLRIRSADPSTNVCFTSAQVGSPFPRTSK